MGPSGGGMVRELGAKSAPQGGALQGRDEYFDPKRARRY